MLGHTFAMFLPVNIFSHHKEKHFPPLTVLLLLLTFQENKDCLHNFQNNILDIVEIRQ